MFNLPFFESLTNEHCCLFNCVLLLGVQFSADGKFLALAERRDCKDFVSLFDCSTWQLVKVSDIYACIFRLFCCVL